MDDGVTRDKIANRPYSVGIGYLMIPNDVDREEYIQTCLRKERISIGLDDGGGVINNCLVAKHVFDYLEFPEDSSQLGSCVSFITDSNHPIPMIIGVFSKGEENSMRDEEKSFKKEIRLGNNIVSIIGKAKTGELFISAESEYEGGGNIDINLKNQDNTSAFNVNCFGTLNLYSEGETKVKTDGDILLQKISSDDEGNETIDSQIQIDENGLVYSDKFSNNITAKDGEIDVNSTKKINCLGATSSAALGDELKAQLSVLSKRVNSIYDAVNNATGNTAILLQASMKAILAVNKNIEDFSNIVSKKIFIE